jgi:hypothetical protein
MSDREAAVALRAAAGLGGETGRGGGGGVLGPVLRVGENAASDLRDIVLSLPRLPGFMLQEPKEILDPETGIAPSLGAATEALGKGDIRGAVAQVAGAPGVRLVPGSYTAEMLGGGREGDRGPGELVEHPVFTLLDLLPIASKAGLTDKALGAIKGSSPYRRAAAGLEKRGVGGKAVDVNRMVRQIQRAADEGSIGEVPIGGTGKMGSINELREYLVENWVKQFSRKELAESYDFLEQGHWAEGRPAPQWAIDSGRADAWVTMALDAEAMGKWWKDHGIKTGELLMVGSEIFPNTPDVRKHLKNLKEAAEGKDTTVKKFGTQTAKARNATVRAQQHAETLAGVESQLAGVDPLAYSSTLDRLAVMVNRLENPDLGVADDVAAAQSRLDADTAAAARFKPTETTVVEDFPWPEDLPPLRPGESGWLTGERSPTVTGEEVVTRARGKAPTREETKLLAVTEKLDGTTVGTNAAELVAKRLAAEQHYRVVVKKNRFRDQFNNLRDMTVRQARRVADAITGSIRGGSIEDAVRALHESELADLADEVALPGAKKAEAGAVADLDAPAYRPTGGGGKLEPVEDTVKGVKQPVSELEQRVRERKAEGWKDRTIKGNPYHRVPSQLGELKHLRERKSHDVRRATNALEKSKAAADTRPVIGTPEAAALAKTRVVGHIEGPVRAWLTRMAAEGKGRHRPRTPEDFRIDHPTAEFREGVDFPTRLTDSEKNLIRKTGGAENYHKIVYDADGQVWEVYRSSSTKADIIWDVRRLRHDADPPGGKYVFDEWSDAKLDTMAAAEAWGEADLGAFNKAETDVLTPESVDGMVEELVAAAETVDDAFWIDGEKYQSVAAAQVLDKITERVPERLATRLERDPVLDYLRGMRDGVPESTYAPPGFVLSDTITRLTGELAELDARVRIDEVAAEHSVRLATEVLEAADAVTRYKGLEQQLVERLRRVGEGEGRPTFVERKVKVRNPDEVRLRDTYDLLDELETTGPSHPLYSTYDELVAVAQQLEEAGVRVAPTGAKAKAATGKKSRKVKDPGDVEAMKAARARRKKSLAELDRVKRVESAVATSMSNLKAALVGTLESPGPLRIAEVHARVVEFKEARAALSQARTRLKAVGKDGRGPRMVRDRAREKGHPLADTLDDLERQIDDLFESMPTTKQYTQLLRKKKNAADNITKAQSKARLAEAGAATATRRVAAEMTDAQLAVTKWEANPRKALPAALHPLYNEALAEMLAKAMDNPSPDAVRKLTFERLDEAAVAGGLKPKEWNAMKREAMTVVKELVESGRTPVWMPHRQVGNRGRAPGKLFGERIVSPQQFKKRHLNPEPYVRNLAIAVEQNTVDHIRRLATETLYFGDAEFVGIFETFGRTMDDLTDMYSDAIEAAAIARPWEKRQNLAFEIIKENWTRIDPESWGLAERWSPQSRIKYTKKGTPGAEPIQITIEEIFVPRGVNTTIEGFQKTGGLVPFRGVYDKVMDVFRVSALALSPRFLVYNAIGGMVMLMGRTDPTVLLQLERAKKLVAGDDFPVGISKGAAMADPDLTRAFSNDLARYATNRTGFLWGMQEGAWLGEAAAAVRKVANKSFQVNEWFDNVYRAMAYLHESDRAIAKGIPKAEAAERGVRLANKILQDWDAMTPWERVAMRRILPFYGWMKHVLKYTFTLPYDHPLRVSILTNFASNEMEDYRTGIPQWLSHTFFIGKEGPDTKQWSINARAVNPFSDVANYADFDAREYGSGVIAGFFTQTSPLIAAAAQTLGVDPMSGRGRLYPEVSYDPERGRLQTVAPSIIHTLPEAIIPQIAGLSGLVELTGVTSVSRELRNMRVRDADAFQGRIWTSFGLPFAPRKRSRPFEMMRAGLARDQAASEAVNSALRSGDWSNALGYEQATIRGQTFKVRALYDLAKNNPELLEAVLGATGR